MSTDESTKSPVLKRHRLGWYIFDFANSVLIINGGLYFPQWLVLDNGLDDLWFNVGLVVTSLLLVLTGPTLGAKADASGKGISYLKISSAAMLVSVLAIFGIDNGFSNPSHKAFAGLVCFVVLMYFYQLSLVFYNVLLADIATKERYARTSGLGLASGWLGGILGILAIYPFVEGYIPFFQPAGRTQAFLPSAILYAILTAVSFYLLRSFPSRRNAATPGTTTSTFRSQITHLWRNKPILHFLVAFFIFSDAILTIQNNASIYLGAAMGFSDEIKALEFLLLLFTAAVGGIVSGLLMERVGNRRVLVWLLTVWPLVLVAISFTHHPLLFSILFGIVGLLFGGIWNVARVMFMLLIPLAKRGEYFGFYSSFEKCASLSGPLIWGGIVYLGVPYGDFRYRLAMLSMATLIFASLLYFRVTFTSRNEKAGPSSDS